jgi:hypothetical protein
MRDGDPKPLIGRKTLLLVALTMGLLALLGVSLALGALYLLRGLWMAPWQGPPAGFSGPADDEGAPAQAPRQHDTADLIAAIDQALAARPDELKPGVLIFPALDDHDRVRPDGVTLGNLALFASTYTPHRRLATCIPYFQELLAAAGCTKPGTTLDRESVGLCTRAAGTELHVVPRVRTREDDTYELTVSFHGDGKTYRDRTFKHTLPPEQLRRAPGLIARDVLEHLGVPLSPEELHYLTTPQLEADDDLELLGALWLGSKDYGEREATMKALLARNPRCVHAWEMYLNHSRNPQQALSEFNQVEPPLECDRLRVSAAVSIRDRGRAEDALLMLLKLAPSHRDDTWYQSSLTLCGLRLGDERLTEHLLEVWQREDPGYAGCLVRGQTLIEWAWEARGTGWAFTVTPEGWRLFDARLRRARAELEEALRLNPSGWVAHASLLTVAMGLGLPRAYLEEHFHKAVGLRPRYHGAYSGKLLYLKPRWHGTPAELLAFGRECVATGYWDEGIPQLLSEVVDDFCLDSDNGALRYRGYQDPDLWQAAQDYYRRAEKYAGRRDRKAALNQLARWGVCGRHYDDVVVAFQKLVDPDRVDRKVFPDDQELAYFRDLVYARTGRLGALPYLGMRNDQALAETGIALAEGNLALAEQKIGRIVPGVQVDPQQVACYGQAITLGRKLGAEGGLSPQETLQVLVGVGPLWRGEREGLVCTLPAGASTEVLFPLGIRHGVISGTLEWSGAVSYVEIKAHTQALRDTLYLQYLPQRSVVQLVRNRYWVEQAPYQPGPQEFRIEYRAGRDVLQPYQGVTWGAVVHDDGPSGFGFRIGALDEQPATVTLRDLRIQLNE